MVSALITVHYLRPKKYKNDSFIIHTCYFHLKALKLFFFFHEGRLLFMVMQNDHLHTLKTTFLGTFEGQRWWVHLRGAGHLVVDWSNWRSPVMDLQFVISTRCLRLLHFFLLIVIFFSIHHGQGDVKIRAEVLASSYCWFLVDGSGLKKMED